MDSHKTTVLALSLSVLTLAVVSTFLSLNQSGVLGDSTSAGSPMPAKPTLVARPVESKICGEIKGLFNNYCLRGKDDQVVTDSNGSSTQPGEAGAADQPFDARPENSGLSGVCGDLFKLTGQFCPTVTGGPMPTSVCKYGVNSFAVGTACKTAITPPGSVQPLIYREPSYTSAKYTCYDGKEGTVSSPKSSCVGVSVLKELARKACEGHSMCKNPEKPTGRPEEPKHCTGNKDCQENETCLLPIPVKRIGQAAGAQPEWLAFGKCVPKAKTTVSPRVTINPKVTLLPTRGALTCTWCGTSCTFQRAGLKCPLISAPAGKDCTLVGNSCKVVDLKD